MLQPKTQASTSFQLPTPSAFGKHPSDWTLPPQRRIYNLGSLGKVGGPAQLTGYEAKWTCQPSLAFFTVVGIPFPLGLLSCWGFPCVKLHFPRIAHLFLSLLCHYITSLYISKAPFLHWNSLFLHWFFFSRSYLEGHKASSILSSAKHTW